MRSATTARQRGSAQKLRPTTVGVTTSGGLHSAAWATAATATAAVSSAAVMPARPRRVTSGPPALLGADHAVPELAVLLLVGGPDLLLGHLAEGGHVGGVHLHALGLEELLGLGQVVDALGQLAHLLLGLAADVHEELLLLGGEALPDLEIHHQHGGPVVVEGQRDVLGDLVDLERIDVVDGQVGAVTDALLGGRNHLAPRHRHRAGPQPVHGVG